MLATESEFANNVGGSSCMVITGNNPNTNPSNDSVYLVVIQVVCCIRDFFFPGVNSMVCCGTWD